MEKKVDILHEYVHSTDRDVYKFAQKYETLIKVLEDKYAMNNFVDQLVDTYSSHLSKYTHDQVAVRYQELRERAAMQAIKDLELTKISETVRKNIRETYIDDHHSPLYKNIINAQSIESVSNMDSQSSEKSLLQGDDLRSFSEKVKQQVALHEKKKYEMAKEKMGEQLGPILNKGIRTHSIGKLMDESNQQFDPSGDNSWAHPNN